MKQIKLTQGKYALVDDEDFDFLNQWKWHLLSNGYAMRNECLKGDTSKKRKMRCIIMHRLIMNPPKKLQIDHIDGNPLNNQKFNLRICDSSQNQMNRKISKNNTSGYKGVNLSLIKDKLKIYKYWRAQIKVNKIKLHLGHFKTKKEAATAYNRAAVKYFGSFAKLNNI